MTSSDGTRSSIDSLRDVTSMFVAGEKSDEEVEEAEERMSMESVVKRKNSPDSVTSMSSMIDSSGAFEVATQSVPKGKENIPVCNSEIQVSYFIYNHIL